MSTVTGVARAWRLQRFLRRAGRHSPYYRRLFGELGFVPERVRGIDDLSALPILERQDLGDHARELASETLPSGHALYRHTSGATGVPLRLPVTEGDLRREVLLWLRGYIQHGLKPWHRQAKFAFAVNIPSSPSPWQRFGFFSRRYMDIATTAAEKIDWLRAVEPQAVFGWSSILDEVCTELERRGERLRVSLAFTASDMLFPERRRRIAERLGARIVDAYGAIETGPTAWECPAGAGYHVDDGSVVTEIVDENGRAAASGRIVCTVLWRRAIPLIRYATGDLGTWAEQPCPCGGRHRLLARLEGREIDLVKLPSGETLNAGTIVGLVRDLPGLRHYQVVQSSPDAFVFLLCGDPSCGTDVDRTLRDRCARRIGPDLRLQVRWVREIYQPRGTKYTTLISQARLDAMRKNGVDIAPLLEPDRPS